MHQDLLNDLINALTILPGIKAKQILWRILNIFPKLLFWKNTHPKIINFSENFDFIPIDGITNDYNIFTFLNESHNLNEDG